VRQVVVAGHCEDGWPKGAEERGGALELSRPAAVREVAGGDDELRLDPLDEARERLLDFGLLVRADVEIGNVEEPGRHNRTRL
jgi:hypothetical protein